MDKEIERIKTFNDVPAKELSLEELDSVTDWAFNDVEGQRESTDICLQHIKYLLSKISKLEKVKEAAERLQIVVKENIYESKAMVSLKDYEDLNNDLGKTLKALEEKE